jgi:hypothetical protein
MSRINPAERLIAKSLKRYPTLWGNDKDARMRMLAHLFLVNGNGYEWVGCEIKDWWKAEGHKANPAIYTQQYVSMVERMIGKSMVEHRICRANAQPPLVTSIDSYPYNLLWKMPKDAKSEWKELAQEVLNYFLNSPDISQEVKKGLRRIQNSLKKRIPDWPNIKENKS